MTPSRVSDALLDLVPDPIWVADVSGAITYYNPAFERWWESLTGVPPRRGITVDAASSLHDAQQRALAGRSVMVDIHVVVSGIERAYVIHANPLRREGEVVAAGFVVREISERSQTQDAAIELSLTNLFAADDEALELQTLGFHDASLAAIRRYLRVDSRSRWADELRARKRTIEAQRRRTFASNGGGSSSRPRPAVRVALR